MNQSVVFAVGFIRILAPPPYVIFASTWHHTSDGWDQAFPVFRSLPLPCIILNANRRTKNRRPGNEAREGGWTQLMPLYRGLAQVRTTLPHMAGKNPPGVQRMAGPGVIFFWTHFRLRLSAETCTTHAQFSWHTHLPGDFAGNLELTMATPRRVLDFVAIS